MSSTAILILGGQGYVGSALAGHLLAAGFEVQSVDCGLRGTPGPAPNQLRRYQELSAQELGEFGTIVLLAGHSTVSACADTPAAAFENNVMGFVELVHKLRGQKFLYASSISVYIRTLARPGEEADPLPEAVAVYDHHKQSLERYARLTYPQAYGLRFGTVCGPASNMRAELLLNGLVRSAVCQGRVVVANPQAHRPILGVGDLGRSVEAILTGSVPPGCYNLATDNVRIGDVAERVARRFQVPVIPATGSTPYDILVSTARFRQAASFTFEDTVDSLMDALALHYTGELL